MSGGLAEFAALHRQRLAPRAGAGALRRAARDGSTQLSTVALLDGPFSSGRVKALRVPISGTSRPGPAAGVRAGLRPAWRSRALRLGALQLGRTQLAGLRGRPGRGVPPARRRHRGACLHPRSRAQRAARLIALCGAGDARRAGRLARVRSSPTVAARMGNPGRAGPAQCRPGLQGTFKGSGISGTFDRRRCDHRPGPDQADRGRRPTGSTTAIA